jgi:GcrA cell cycle regulator
MHHDTPWTDVAQARLRDLWDEGLSTAEIGRRLHISKNSVIGKAHRLDLPKRPSPIRYSDGPQPPRVPATRPSPSPVEPPKPDCLSPASSAHDAKPEAGTTTPIPTRKIPLVTTTAPAPIPSYRVTECCWPIGDPGTPDFRFCDAPALPGKPYCVTHARLAYVTIRGGDDRAVA